MLREQDKYVCQYGLWTMTQFASVPRFQEQVSELCGVELIVRCMQRFWPKDPQVWLLHGTRVRTPRPVD
jgi:hypothetical protein